MDIVADIINYISVSRKATFMGLQNTYSTEIIRLLLYELMFPTKNYINQLFNPRTIAFVAFLPRHIFKLAPGYHMLGTFWTPF